MYLLLGDPHDPWCLSVRTALAERRHPARILANPLVDPSRFAWWLTNERSTGELGWDSEPPVPVEDIAGVLVRRSGWLDPAGWQPGDLAYMQVETQAALLAWLWSLPCPVVNRYPSAVWYQPQAPLLSWQRLLRSCGLPTLETLVTNVEQEARAFERSLAQASVAGAVYGPLTSPVRYLVASDRDWHGLAALQRYAPVCLAPPHGAAHFVCVAGEQVVWEGEPSAETALLEPALRRFAAAAGLAFVELALALTAGGIRVIAVEPYPCFEHFGDAARRRLVEGIVDLLTRESGAGREEPAQLLAGSLA